MDDAARWRLIDEERQRLDNVLAALQPGQWELPTLCGDWDVRHVVAHLSAAGSTATPGWLVNMARSGFNTDRHNTRLLAGQLGRDFSETLARYRLARTRRIAPLGSSQGLLGEVLVHGQDIARPNNLALEPSAPAVREVAEFFAAKDFAVNSKGLVKGLALVALDNDFATGAGPEVRGSLLDLVMAMAGRREACLRLEGDGAAALAARIG